jgi:hypothetical protein
MSTTRAVWFFVVALTAIRLLMLATTDLEFDEAHYWMWSQRLAPAYFSKGPAIAFVIRASTAVFGSNEFGVRFFSPLLAAGTSLLLFYFARRLFNATAGLWAVVALNVTPIFNIGAFLMTIDALSVFCWLAAMFTFWLAVEKSPHFSWFWPLTGLLIGLGFLSKYTNALELVSIVLVLALAPRLRREFARPGVYSLLGVFAVCTIPPIVWNQQHAGASAFAGKSRARLWCSSVRGSFVCWPAFSGLFAISLSGSRVGRDRKLSTRQSAIQGAFLNVVWLTRVSLLLAPFIEQGRCAKLGRTRFSGLRPFGNSFLVGKIRSEHHGTTGRGRGGPCWAHDERDRAGHRLAAHGGLPLGAERSKRQDARMEKCYELAGKNA